MEIDLDGMAATRTSTRAKAAEQKAAEQKPAIKLITFWSSPWTKRSSGVHSTWVLSLFLLPLGRPRLLFPLPFFLVFFSFAFYGQNAIFIFNIDVVFGDTGQFKLKHILFLGLEHIG